ncbi:MAG TPA: hypothetical protein VK712_01485 [Verrucomicrobiae bacterium]|jgi:hypothetical protein|nr:hypothetical protein [Verrucomicrobiae bacterium]
MPIQIEFNDPDGNMETEFTDLGQITTLYDFAEHDVKLVVASAVQLQYYGQLAIYRCRLQDIMENFSIGSLFSPILSSHIAEATQEKYLTALCGDEETYETSITNPKSGLIAARFTLLGEEAAAGLY